MSPEQDSNNSGGSNTAGDNQGNASSGQSAAPKVISLSIKDLMVLYTAYMPFIANGGLFIPTKKAFNMGDVLPLMISLMEDPIKYSVDGKVVWMNPTNSQARPPGIGVQFMGANAVELSKKIQNLLIAYGKSTEPTNTR